MPIAPTPINPNAEVRIRWQRISRWVLRLWGWRIAEWKLPDDVKKVVVAGEHHTSNMDGFLMVFMAAAMGRKLSWLVKAELNKPVINGWIRASGGIFVDRHAKNGTVGQVVEQMNAADSMFLVMAPSATRRKTDRWRSGFYYMALGAQVPIALGYIDYAKKEGGIGKMLVPSGNIKADEAVFQEFFNDITPRYPHKASTVCLDPPKMLEETPSE